MESIEGGPASIAALAGEAHVWLADPKEWTAAANLAASRALLEAAEGDRYEAIRHPVARCLFLVGRALARRALSRYAAVEPPAWRFADGEHGRPEIAGPAAAPPLRFNLSHSEDLVACVVTVEDDCGIDVEDTRRRLDAFAIADHSFAPEETVSLWKLEEPARSERFFRLWVLKEAHLKARGAGMALRLDSVVFDLEREGEIGVRFAPRLAGAPAEWQTALYAPTRFHRLALAVRAGRGAARPVRGRRLAPDGTWRPFELRELASGRRPAAA